MKKGAQQLLDNIRKDQNKTSVLSDVHDKMEKERTAKLSIKEGSSATVMSIGSDYLTPFALALKANNAQIGFLSSIPSLIAPIAQIWGSKMMESSSRKKIIFRFVFLQALMWLPIFVLALLAWRNLFPNALPTLLIVLYTLMAVFGAIAGPPWFSLMGDIVPENIRGRYFGKRNKITGSVYLIATFVAGFFLDYTKTHGIVLAGFAAIFLVSAIARSFSAGMFTRHYDPPFKLQKGYYFSFWQFVKKAPQTNFGKFTIMMTLLYFAVGIPAPFFAVYSLQNLHFSYITYMLVLILAQSIFTLLFMPIAGRFADKYGSRELLKIGMILIPIVPFLWLLSKSPIYIAFVPQLFAGVGWAAISLSSTNFIYDSVSVSKRGLCVAYFNILTGASTFIGTSIGGLMAQYLHISFMNVLLFIFVISGIIRILVSVVMMPRVKETKTFHPAKSIISYFKEISPIKGMVFELYDDLKSVTNGMVNISQKSLKSLDLI